MDMRLEILESTVDNIKTNVVRLHDSGVTYCVGGEVDKLFDEWVMCLSKYNSLVTEQCGVKCKDVSDKSKQLYKLILVDKYNNGEIANVLGGSLNG